MLLFDGLAYIILIRELSRSNEDRSIDVAFRRKRKLAGPADVLHLPSWNGLQNTELQRGHSMFVTRGSTEMSSSYQREALEYAGALKMRNFDREYRRSALG
jgi:hypothetical protein